MPEQELIALCVDSPMRGRLQSMPRAGWQMAVAGTMRGLASCSLHLKLLEREDAAAAGLYAARYMSGVAPEFDRWKFNRPETSLSPNPRQKLLPDQGVAAAYNAMVDEIEILSAVLVASGWDPKAVLKTWRRDA